MTPAMTEIERLREALGLCGKEVAEYAEDASDVDLGAYEACLNVQNIVTAALAATPPVAECPVGFDYPMRAKPRTPEGTVEQDSRAELLAKLGAAPEGSRELDAEIAIVALGWHRDTRRASITTPDGKSAYAAPRFTSSIDDALMLVPTGALHSIGHAGDMQPGLFRGVVMPLVGRFFEGHSRVEPIALAIAALRARSTDHQERTR